MKINGRQEDLGSPFLGASWSAVRCRTCQRGAAGISVLQCTVGVDGTVEVVGTSGDEQLILRCKTYNEWHAVLSPSESESYRPSLSVNGSKEKPSIDWRIVSISCYGCGICNVVICWIIRGDCTCGSQLYDWLIVGGAGNLASRVIVWTRLVMGFSGDSGRISVSEWEDCTILTIC